MLDTPLEPASGGRYPADMESRVAILEQIARSTVTSLERIERRLDSLVTRTSARFDTIDRRFDLVDTAYRGDLRWLLGIMLGGFGALLGVMAHGFRWL